LPFPPPPFLRMSSTSLINAASSFESLLSATCSEDPTDFFQ
jgi:hypothetical protein